MFYIHQVTASLIFLALLTGCGQNMRFVDQGSVFSKGIEVPPDDLPPLTGLPTTSTTTSTTAPVTTTTTQLSPPPPTFPLPTTTTSSSSSSSSSTSTTSTSTSTSSTSTSTSTSSSTTSSSSSTSTSTSTSTTSTTSPPASSTEITQSFRQGKANSKVDILFVVDNALSMVDSLQSVAGRFSTFIGELNSADWQIGVTTTDVSNGVYGLKGSLVRLEGLGNQKVLTASTPRKEQVFANTLVRPETISCGFSPSNPCASPWVQPIRASQLAMEKQNTDNRGFFRAGADLAIVTISNKDEMRNGRDFQPTQPESLINTFNLHFASEGKKLATFGIVIPSAQATCLAEMKRKWNWDPSPATFQERLSKLTGGDIVSICSSDFGAELSRLGQGVRKLTQSFDLRITPKEGTVKIQLRPMQSIRFEVRERRITFESAPQADTEITVTYEPAP